MHLYPHHLAPLLAAALLPAAAGAAPTKADSARIWDAAAPMGLAIPFTASAAGWSSAGSYPRLGAGNGGLYAGEGGGSDAKGSGSIYNWAGPPGSEPDWDGVTRDTLYFLGWQFAAIGILYVMPESVSGWTDEDKEEYNLDRWWDNVSNPVWDEDEWYVNYLLHPYWGGAYYVRARERGLGEGQAFVYSAFNSALYEFGAEALFEPSSYTDLIVTPLFGWLLGEYVFVPWRERIRANPAGIGTAEKTLLTLTDPLGVIYGATDSALGVQSDFSFGLIRQPDIQGASWGPQSRAQWQESPIASRHREPAWGMQWQVAW